MATHSLAVTAFLLLNLAGSAVAQSAETLVRSGASEAEINQKSVPELAQPAKVQPEPALEDASDGMCAAPPAATPAPVQATMSKKPKSFATLPAR
jgi:hypothetical protein